MREAQRADVRVWLKELRESFPDARIIVSSRPTAIKEGWMDAEGLMMLNFNQWNWLIFIHS